MNASSPALVLALSVLLAGCAPLAGHSGGGGGIADGPGDQVRAAASVGETVRDLPKSPRGNMAEYTVFGKRYRTLDSAAGFRERGVASWYGAKFHGRDTSSGEPFDMHALTAAHRHLPLPTFVRVSDVDTGASIIVKVNDRGPFADDRVIDLSYAAALQLGMLEHGTAEVTIEALSMHASPEARAEAATAAPAPLSPRPVPAAAGESAPAGVDETSTGSAVVQLGAFAERENAEAFARRVSAHLPRRPAVEHEPGRSLYRVRTSPIADARTLEHTLERLSAAGIESYTLLFRP